jgi:hypothetical protein
MGLSSRVLPFAIVVFLRVIRLNHRLDDPTLARRFADVSRHCVPGICLQHDDPLRRNVMLAHAGQK